jgi:hypothetical protein
MTDSICLDPYADSTSETAVRLIDHDSRAGQFDPVGLDHVAVMITGAYHRTAAAIGRVIYHCLSVDKNYIAHDHQSTHWQIDSATSTGTTNVPYYLKGTSVELY